MKESTYSHIKKLLDESGLFPLDKSNKKIFSSYDFSNETILVTGAAGYIGSGIVNQLLFCSFKKLILIDNAESSLYYLTKELELQNRQNIDFSILDIRDETSIKRLFDLYKPTLIFHTAAYKHVSLMEDNPYEAVKLNIFATKLLANLAIEYKCKKFIFISTDKAVKPISVMGMTKRIAERYLTTLNSNFETLFLITRFGNIFGSTGSIVPLVLKQLESGQAIKITNKNATRYFINKDAACNNILKIATMPKLESQVFAFNMGSPIKIMDLAEILINIYKSKHSYKTEIEMTALGSGEKLHEDLVSDDETLKPIGDDDIFLVIEKENTNTKPLDLNTLSNMASYESLHEIKSILANYI